VATYPQKQNQGFEITAATTALCLTKQTEAAPLSKLPARRHNHLSSTETSEIPPSIPAGDLMPTGIKISVISLFDSHGGVVGKSALIVVGDLLVSLQYRMQTAGCRHLILNLLG
jgi:hypothetical protein